MRLPSWLPWFKSDLKPLPKGTLDWCGCYPSMYRDLWHTERILRVDGRAIAVEKVCFARGLRIEEPLKTVSVPEAKP